jgi:hypothetical protein
VLVPWNPQFGCSSLAECSPAFIEQCQFNRLKVCLRRICPKLHVLITRRMFLTGVAVAHETQFLCSIRYNRSMPPHRHDPKSVRC